MCSRAPSCAGSRRTSPRTCSGRRTARPRGMRTRSLVAPLFALRAVERGALVRTRGRRSTARRARVRRQDDRRRRSAPAASSTPPGPGRPSSPRWSASTLPIRAVGLHVNVTEPRKKVLEPLVQHIGRRLTLKQASNGTFIIGGGWPSRAGAAPGALLDDLGERRRQRRRRGPRDAEPRRRAARPHVDRGLGEHAATSSPSLGESAAVPGYFMCLAPTGFTLGPLVARMLAATHRRGRAAARATSRSRLGKDCAWIETTSPGAATGPRARPRSAPDESYDAERAPRAARAGTSTQGLHGVLINGTTGRVVLAVGRGAHGGRRERDRARSPGGSRS